MEYQRDTECIRCHGWFDKADGHVTPATDGAWFVCDKCWEALGQDEDEEYSAKVEHEGRFEDEAVVIQAEAPEHPNALLTRKSAGVRVEACFLPLVDLFGISVTIGAEQAWASVDPENFRDAFDHPALYLSAPQCEAIGLR